MLASRGWSDGNVEFSARNAVYREQAKCEAFSKYNCVPKISIQITNKWSRKFANGKLQEANFA